VRSEDLPLDPTADLDGLAELVGEMAAAHEALHRTVDLLVEVTHTIVATQRELLATVVGELGGETSQQLEDALSFDLHLGARRQAKQNRAHSEALRLRAEVLAEQARTIRDDTAELLPRSNAQSTPTATPPTAEQREALEP
jgi:hypothetical protein